MLRRSKVNKDSLYNHYEKTCSERETAQVNRNKFFLLSLICIVGLAVFLVLPDILVQAILSWLQIDVSTDMDTLIFIIQSLNWALLFYVLIRYVQANIQVERSYPYIYQLEKELEISREGDGYLNDYPVILNFIDFVYKKLYPLFAIVSVFAKSVLEWASPNRNIVCCFIDSVLALFTISLMVLYMAFLHKVDAYYKDRQISGAQTSKKTDKGNN